MGKLRIVSAPRCGECCSNLVLAVLVVTLRSGPAPGSQALRAGTDPVVQKSWPVVVSGCGIRVAGEERCWVEGECIFFDNSFEHEAWNKSETRRLIFAVYLAHPETTPVEREALRRLQVRYKALASLGPEAMIAWAGAGARPGTAA